MRGLDMKFSIKKVQWRRWRWTVEVGDVIYRGTSTSYDKAWKQIQQTVDLAVVANIVRRRGTDIVQGSE